VVGVTDHPADFAAGPDRPGVDPRLRNNLGVLFLVTLDA
jgi:hypothetical protein